MAKFRVNTREFGRRIQAAARANGAAAMKAMQDVGHYLRGQVQLRTPVDEGNLTADIAMRVVEYQQSLATVLFIPSNAPSSQYAVKMHEGFYRLGDNSIEKQRKVQAIVGRKFITRAIDENRTTIKEIIKSNLKI